MQQSYQVGDVIFQHWKIVKYIGEGSFGIVYEIERVEFDITYKAALKVISVPQSQMEVRSVREEGMDAQQSKKYFYSMVQEIVNEFALMSKLKGTGNVVNYEDHQIIPSKNFDIGWDILIRMELLNPLMTYAYENPFTYRDIVQLGVDVCRALELCKKNNVVHRDIKPENIFVSQNGDFKLGDFGIARTVEKTTGGLSKKGTYSYMAPEVYCGLEYGFTVDIYSLGIVLYRLLNKNRAPFLPAAPTPITYNDREKSLAMRINGHPMPAPFYNNGRLTEIILKACAHEAKARYSSAAEMRADLEALLDYVDDTRCIYPEEEDVEVEKNEYFSSISRGGAVQNNAAATFDRKPENSYYQQPGVKVEQPSDPYRYRPQVTYGQNQGAYPQNQGAYPQNQTTYPYSQGTYTHSQTAYPHNQGIYQQNQMAQQEKKLPIKLIVIGAVVLVCICVGVLFTNSRGGSMMNNNRGMPTTPWDREPVDERMATQGFLQPY